MKHITIPLLVLSMFFQLCGQDYEVEDQLAECMYDASSAMDLDLKAEMRNFENYLVDIGVFEDKSPEAYYNFYRTIAHEGGLSVPVAYNFNDTLKAHANSEKLSIMNNNCYKIMMEAMASESYEDSKFVRLQSAMDSLRENGKMNGITISETVTRILEPSDFKNDYYRITTLTTMFTAPPKPDPSEVQIIRKGDPGEKMSHVTDPRNIIQVKVPSKEGFVMVNGEEMPVDSLFGLAVRNIVSDPESKKLPEMEAVNINNIGRVYQSKVVFMLSKDKNASDEHYQKVYDDLINAHLAVRNEAASKFFKTQYNRLGYQLRKSVDEFVPIRIVEKK